MSRDHLPVGLLDKSQSPHEREATRAVARWCWPAWFAGCDLKVLARTPSEVTFYNALGSAVLLLSCLGGFAAFFSISYVLKEPAAAIGVGIAWALIMSCAVERLLLQVVGSRKDLGALAVAVAPRLFVSVLIGFILAEPLLLKINGPEIEAFITGKQRAARHQLIREAKGTYEGTVSEKKAELGELRDQVPKIEARLSNLLADSGCATTQLLAVCAAREAGCDAACQRDAGNAIKEKQKLDRVRKENAERQPALEASLDKWRGKRGEEENGGRQTITDSDGVMARIEALGALAGAHPSVGLEVWILRLFFISLDLLPLAIKTTRVWSAKSPYELRMVAARNRDGLAAEAEEAATEVAKQRITEQARADKRVLQAEIAAKTERRMYEASGDTVPDFVPHDLASTEPVAAMPFDEFVESIEHYESRAVNVPDALRLSALIGFALMGAALAIAFMLTSAAGIAVAGGWLLMIAFGLATALCISTHGFRQAPAWAMRPILATFITGLILPPFVLVLNVV